MARDVVLASDGLSVSLPALLENELKRRHCVILPIDPPWIRLNYGFVWKRGRTHSPAAEALMGHILAVEEETPA
ncbi:LysR substrate-binding domain-containing protein [Methylocystis heyeri]|uniref:LysR substrate-binding domain-containing protein n=1 Tax=Methylocystis heyeri TaxID=391905 RepID=UPI003CCE4F9A